MPQLRGAQHQRVKLTDHDVLAIRVYYAPGVIRMQELADRHDVDVSTVSYIVSGRSWAHLPVGKDQTAAAVAEEATDQ